jgi:hypothetical protein
MCPDVIVVFRELEDLRIWVISDIVRFLSINLVFY